MNRRQSDYPQDQYVERPPRVLPSIVRGPPMTSGATYRPRSIATSSTSQRNGRINNSPTAQPSRSSGQSYFSSSRNVEVNRSSFHTTQGPHTNLTINVNQAEVGYPADEDTTAPRTDQSPELDRQQGSFVERAPPARQRVVLPSTSAPQKSSERYARLLGPSGRGFPLWIPEPHQNLPVVYRRTGVRIGDVGIITPSGSFSFLFNIFAPIADPIYASRLPENFAPLTPSPEAIDIRMLSEFKPGSYLASSSIEKSECDSASGLSFKLSASEGAILTMPEGATSEDLEDVARIRKYVSGNLIHWYRYVNGPRGRDARNGDIRIVVGCDKSTSWGMATMTNTTQEMNCQIKFRSLQSDASSDAAIATYAWEHSGLAEVRAGPDAQEIEELRSGDPSAQPDGKYRNQCLFLRTMNPTLGDEEWLNLCQELDTPHLAESCRNKPTEHGPDRHDSRRSGQSTSSGNSSGACRPPSHKPFGHRRVHPFSEGLLPNTRTPAVRVSMSASPAAISCHPSEVINATLLKKMPNAKMVITEDSNWFSMFKEGDHALPCDEELLERLLENYHIEEDNGVVFFQSKDLRQDCANLTQREKDHIISATSLQLPENHFHDVNLNNTVPDVISESTVRWPKHQNLVTKVCDSEGSAPSGLNFEFSLHMCPPVGEYGLGIDRGWSNSPDRQEHSMRCLDEQEFASRTEPAPIWEAIDASSLSEPISDNRRKRYPCLLPWHSNRSVEEGQGGDSADFVVSKLESHPQEKDYLGDYSACALTKTKGIHYHNKPYLAPITVARELFPKVADRNCVHIEFNTEGSGITYQHGDHVGLWTLKPDVEVERLLCVLSLHDKRDAIVGIEFLDPALARVPFPVPAACGTILRHNLDIRAVAGRQILGTLSKFAPTPEAEAYLKKLNTDKELYHKIVHDGCLKLGEVLQLAAGNELKALPTQDNTLPWPIPFDTIVSAIPCLQSRCYSISSSTKLHHNSVHATAVVLRYESQPRGHVPRKWVYGVGTNFLLKLKHASNSEPVPLVSEDGEERVVVPAYFIEGPRGAYKTETHYKAPIHIRPSTFGLPTNLKSPVIMIDPGTGVVPFRGFIQERVALARRSIEKNGSDALADWGRISLFHCGQNSTEDFLYKDEWPQHEEELQGKFKIHTAFCRENFRPDGSRIYVQDLIWEDRENITNTILNGKGYAYIYGDAKGMRAQVEEILARIFGEAKDGSAAVEGAAGIGLPEEGSRLMLVWS